MRSTNICFILCLFPLSLSPCDGVCVCGCVWLCVCLCGVCGANDSRHGESVLARAGYAPNSGGRTPGSKLPASPPPGALNDEELFIIEG